jgi:hypothetical protein
MMKRLLTALISVALFVGVQPAKAQTRNTTAARMRLVRAQCTTGPCAPQFNFKRGDMQIRSVKNPKPVGDRRFGKVSIVGLDAGLATPPATLDAVVSGTQTFGPDPDGDCALAGTQVTGTFGTSSMICNISAFALGRCRGDLFFTSLLPPQCSDVRRTIEDISVEIYEGGFAGDVTRRIATVGMLILGKEPDCNSGGSGCP